jgi:hypothetical protein
MVRKDPEQSFQILHGTGMDEPGSLTAQNHHHKAQSLQRLIFFVNFSIYTSTLCQGML